MNYKATHSDVGLDDQHLDIKDEMEFTSQDIMALIIAALQFVLPIVALILTVPAILMVLFQIFY
ncbi:MAG: hypothetical protein JEZ08_15115 [Clostridiales bacterium]|nr:hypothetical protein [Clostridiales bacterium]